MCVVSLKAVNIINLKELLSTVFEVFNLQANKVLRLYNKSLAYNRDVFVHEKAHASLSFD